MLDDHTLVNVAKLIQIAPLDEENLETLFNRLTTNFKKHKLKAKQAAKYISVFSSILKAHYEFIEESRRRFNTNDDIDARQARDKAYDRIYQVIEIARVFLRYNSVNNDIHFLRSNSCLTAKTAHNKEVIKSNTLTSPRIDGYMDSSGPFTIDLDRLANIEFFKSEEATMAMVGVSAELLKAPYQGFFASNLVRLAFYGGKEDDFTPASADMALGTSVLKIVFPLRVLPAQESLKDTLKCTRLTYGGKDNKRAFKDCKIQNSLKFRKFNFLTFLDKVAHFDRDKAGNLKVVCYYPEVDFRVDYYAVVYDPDAYDADLNDPRTKKILAHMTEGGDSYKIDDYVPPNRTDEFSALLYVGVFLNCFLMIWLSGEF